MRKAFLKCSKCWPIQWGNKCIYSTPFYSNRCREFVFGLKLLTLRKALRNLNIKVTALKRKFISFIYDIILYIIILYIFNFKQLWVGALTKTISLGMAKIYITEHWFNTHHYILLIIWFSVSARWEENKLTSSSAQARLWACTGVNRLSEVLCREHTLGPSQDGVFGGVIWMLLWGNLQHSWDGLHVGINGVPNHLCDELVDEDDANVTASQETPVNHKQQTYCSWCWYPSYIVIYMKKN